MSEPLLFEITDRIARITLDRAENGNALTSQTVRLLEAAVAQLESQPAVRVVVLAANGPTFSAGGDIVDFVRAGDDLAAMIDRELLRLHATLRRLYELSKAIVCALNGAVAGGAIGFALSADVVIAAESARFRGGYSALGLSPDLGTSFFLTRSIGPQRTTEFLFSNRQLDAHEALALGLVARVVPDAELAAETQFLAEALAAVAPGSIAGIKAVVRAAQSASFAEVLDLEREWIVRNASSPECRDAIRAFVERRAANAVR